MHPPVSPSRSEHTSRALSSDSRLSRKRIARACDQCRRRKSRCDGQLTCSSCNLTGLTCSYGQAIKQIRGPAYVAHLEKKIEELEERARRDSWTSEVSGEEEVPASQQPTHGNENYASLARSEQSSVPPVPSLTSSDSTPSTADSQQMLGSPQPDQMPVYVETVASEPRGKALGTDLLRQLWNFCNQLATTPLSDRHESSLEMVKSLDASLTVPPDNANRPLLSPKAELCQSVNIALSEAFHLWPFVDRSCVERTIRRIYSTKTFGQNEADKDDLALLYALLALGQRFNMSNNLGPEAKRLQGLDYFGAAQAIVPLANCDRSLAAIQTILCLALYLKAGSAQTKAHAYISAAASAALRMGLQEPAHCFPKHEMIMRGKVWSSIRILDVYVSASLGIPHITTSDPEPFSTGPPVPSEEHMISVTHANLVAIFARATEQMQAGHSASRVNGSGPVSIPLQDLQRLSHDLEVWDRSTPALATPIENMTRSQLLLSHAFAYVQLVLYSPFVHHLAQASAISSPGYAYGVKCARAAFSAFNVSNLLHKRMQLNEAYFHTVDTLIFAAIVLLVVELGSSDGTLLREAIRYRKRNHDLVSAVSLENSATAKAWEALSRLQQSVKSNHDEPQAAPPKLFQNDSGIDLDTSSMDLDNPNMDLDGLSMMTGATFDDSMNFDTSSLDTVTMADLMATLYPFSYDPTWVPTLDFAQEFEEGVFV